MVLGGFDWGGDFLLYLYPLGFALIIQEKRSCRLATIRDSSMGSRGSIVTFVPRGVEMAFLVADGMTVAKLSTN